MARRIRVHVRHKPDRKNLLLYFIDPDTGREVSKSAGTANLRAADRAAADWEAEIEEKRGATGAKWSWFRSRFEDEHLVTLAKKSRKCYITALNHFERLIKLNLLEDITSSTISLFQAELIREKRPLTTVAGYMAHVRVALNWGKRVGLIHEAPVVKLPRIGNRTMPRGRPLSFDEFDVMLKAVPKVRSVDAASWRRLLELFWYSGLRLGEGLALKWDAPPIRVDLDADPYPQIIIYGEAQKSRQDEAIPIAPDFAAWLRQTPPEARHGLVAPVRRMNGKMFPVEIASQVISEIGYRAEILVNAETHKYASAHDLRRSFGTRWAKRVRPVTLQRMMRHSNIETTLKYYVGLTTADIGADLYIYSNVPATVPKKQSERKKTEQQNG
jgi:integrase